jgi:hypothetical protein
VIADPGQPEAPVHPESPAPASNDWFRPEGDPAS